MLKTYVSLALAKSPSSRWGLVLPVSLALFPHETSIVVSDMEPLDGSSGSGEAERFHYNKGL